MTVHLARKKPHCPLVGMLFFSPNQFANVLPMNGVELGSV